MLAVKYELSVPFQLIVDMIVQELTLVHCLCLFSGRSPYLELINLTLVCGASRRRPIDVVLWICPLGVSVLKSLSTDLKE